MIIQNKPDKLLHFTVQFDMEDCSSSAMEQKKIFTKKLDQNFVPYIWIYRREHP